ncbi:MAG: hypothetical protein V4579_10590 [Pseudomonadota bacterium]
MTQSVEPLADPIPAACARLGISRSTLYLAAQRGDIRIVKYRGRSLVTRDAQAAFLASLPAMSNRAA